MFFKQVKLNAPAQIEAAKLLWRAFFNEITIVKTPVPVQMDHPLALHDLEDYLIDISAEAIDATVITRDAMFKRLSNRAITSDQALDDIEQDVSSLGSAAVPFLDLKSPHIELRPQVGKCGDYRLGYD